jgi:hypothetical protein
MPRSLPLLAGHVHAYWWTFPLRNGDLAGRCFNPRALAILLFVALEQQRPTRQVRDRRHPDPAPTLL